MEREQHPVHKTFEFITNHIMELNPRHWKQLLQLLEYYIPRELERRGVIPNEMPLPIARTIGHQPRILH